MRTIVLASTSPYRMQLMRQLELNFHVAAPLYQEHMDTSVSAELLVKHQALQKAKSIADKYADALIIGADQVFVDARHRVLGKPGTADNAVQQLMEMQVPMVVAMTMTDAATASGIDISIEVLQRHLGGTPIYPVVATSGRGLEPLKEALRYIADESPPPVPES